jgi:hypothetical protein
MRRPPSEARPAQQGAEHLECGSKPAVKGSDLGLRVEGRGVEHLECGSKPAVKGSDLGLRVEGRGGDHLECGSKSAVKGSDLGLPAVWHFEGALVRVVGNIEFGVRGLGFQAWG